MGLKDIIRKFTEKKEISKQKLKEAEEEIRINRIITERQKSSNERELDRYMKERREEQIKKTLEGIRKKETHDSWSGKNSLMNTKMNMLKDDRPILKEKNIFVDKRNDIPFVNRKEMFFK